MFADCTGDGTLGYLAGASFRMGAEDRTVYGEEFAPDKQEYGELLGHSILFYIKDIGQAGGIYRSKLCVKGCQKH